VKQDSHVWFVDVGKPGFKEEYLKNVLARNAGKGFDGFVFDYWCPSISRFLSGNRPMAYPTDRDWFDKAWKPFIEYVCAGVHGAGYRIIGNCAGEYMSGNPDQEWQRTQVEGTIYEQGAVQWPEDGSGWLPGSVVAGRINHINQDPLEVWVANYGLRRVTEDTLSKRHVALAMYYVAIPLVQNKHSFSAIFDGTPHWDEVWDLYIGTPCSAAPQKIGNYFWSRKYTQGLVLLNYESEKTVTYTLDQQYYDSSGKKYSGKVLIEPHTGLILATGS
jgi:hypothetical protein